MDNREFREMLRQVLVYWDTDKLETLEEVTGAILEDRCATIVTPLKDDDESQAM